MDDVVRQREAAYGAPEGVDWARMGGNIANPVSWAGGGTGALRAMTTGAGQALLNPVYGDDFWTDKAKQAAFGGAVGGVLSKTLHGLTPTKEAAALMAQGIQPTVGQSKGGMWNSMEQKLTSIPLVGDAINYARNRAQREFEGAVLKRAVGVAPEVRHGVTVRASKGAPRTLDEANAIASNQFDAVVPHLAQDMGTLLEPRIVAQDAMKNPEMTAQNKRVLKGLVDEWFDPARLKDMDAEGLKKLDSQLGFSIRKYAAGDPASKTLADEIRNVQSAFRDNLNRLLPPNMKGGLTDANSTYAKLVPVNKAASQRADEHITPRALQKAMARQAHTDVSRMPFDSLVDNAAKVLPSTIPDSGTAGRAMLAGGSLSAATPLGVMPELLTAGAVAGLGATRPVQRAVMGNTAAQKALAPYDNRLVQLLIAALRAKRDN